MIFNFNRTGSNPNRQTSNTMPLNGVSTNDLPSLPPSPYGYRRFGNNNYAAQTHVNTILNHGPGFTGAVAHVADLTAVTTRARANAQRMSGMGNAGRGNFSGFNPPTYGSGPARIMNEIMGRSVPIHGPGVGGRLPSRNATPRPSSGLFVVATVDTPRHPGAPRGAAAHFASHPPPGAPPTFNQYYRYNPPSPALSIGSSSCSSLSSTSSYGSPCLCDDCRPINCTCHLYCPEHRGECPVHGHGINMSDSGYPASLTYSGSSGSSTLSNYSLGRH